MNYSEYLKLRIKDNVMKQNYKGTEYKSAFVFGDIRDNFFPDSFDNITGTINKNWEERLEKRHSHFSKDDIKEMQSSNSSDALLMNIFCHPDIEKWKGVSELLELDFSEGIVFGWQGAGFTNEKGYLTEVDMKIGNVLFESKLTEKDFSEKERQIVDAYDDVDKIFDLDMLTTNYNKVRNYQLVRNILAAAKHECSFNVLLDETRIDLIKALFETVKAVKDTNLQRRIDFFTWQEIASTCGSDLKYYLQNKYF